MLGWTINNNLARFGDDRSSDVDARLLKNKKQVAEVCALRVLDHHPKHINVRVYHKQYFGQVGDDRFSDIDTRLLKKNK